MCPEPLLVEPLRARAQDNIYRIFFVLSYLTEESARYTGRNPPSPPYAQQGLYPTLEKVGNYTPYRMRDIY